MFLQKLMDIHHCVFKILGKNQRRERTHGQTDRRTGEQCDKPYTPHKQSLWRYNQTPLILEMDQSEE